VQEHQRLLGGQRRVVDAPAIAPESPERMKQGEVDPDVLHERRLAVGQHHAIGDRPSVDDGAAHPACLGFADSVSLI